MGLRHLGGYSCAPHGNIQVTWVLSPLRKYVTQALCELPCPNRHQIRSDIVRGPAFLSPPLRCVCTTAVQIYPLVLLSSSFLLHTSPPASSWSSPPPPTFSPRRATPPPAGPHQRGVLHSRV